MRLQTYREPPAWREGLPLDPAEVLDKEEAHRLGRLHRSVHLLLLDGEGRVLARRRSADDLRYAGLWTSTLGTHVEAGSTDEGALRAALPPGVPLAWVGEFRVRDAWENEVCGLFVARADAPPPGLDRDRAFLAPEDLERAIAEGQATPHLAAAWRRQQAHEGVA